MALVVLGIILIAISFFSLVLCTKSDVINDVDISDAVGIGFALTSLLFLGVIIAVVGGTLVFDKKHEYTTIDNVSVIKIDTIYTINTGCKQIDTTYTLNFKKNEHD